MFHERLKYLREKENISREHLAKALDITYSALSKYETGNRQPDFQTLQKFADFFGVTTDYLLGRTDIPSHKESTNLKAWLRSNTDLSEDELEELEDDIEDYLAIRMKRLSEKKK